MGHTSLRSDATPPGPSFERRHSSLDVGVGGLHTNLLTDAHIVDGCGGSRHRRHSLQQTNLALRQAAHATVGCAPGARFIFKPGRNNQCRFDFFDLPRNFFSHVLPLMKCTDRKGFASSAVSSRTHATLSLEYAPGPLQLYCA